MTLLNIWDCLVWGLFVFPLLTGGVWIHRPGLKIELSELSIPVLLITGIGFGLWKIGKISLAKATSIQWMIRVWECWKKWIFKSPSQTLWGAAALIALLEGGVALKRHYAFGSGAADLGIFTNAIWNLTHGYGYISSVKDGMNLFADHQSPLFWVLAPIFYLFPFPETLLIIQAVCMSTAGVAIYYLARQYLPKGHWGLAVVPLLYWSYLPLRNANSFDFHPEILMVPLFLWALVGLQSGGSSILRNRILGGIAFVLALSAKESAPPVAVGISLAWLFGAAPKTSQSWTWKLALFIIPMSILIFWFDVQKVPHFFGKSYAYEGNYRQYGEGLHQVILAPMTHPKMFWTHLLGPARLKFFFWCLAPLAFLPLFNLRTAIASLPSFLVLFLSEGDHRVNLIYHYSAEPAVGLFWSLPMALIAYEKIQFSHWIKRGWILFWCFAALGRSEIYRYRIYEITPHHQWLRKELIPCLEERTWSVSGALVPHLANRHWTHHLPNIEMPEGRWVDCAIYDSDINNWPLKGEEMSNFWTHFSDVGFQSEYTCKNITIFKRTSSVHSCLRCIPGCNL